jgi:hypothetical protein
MRTFKSHENIEIAHRAWSERSAIAFDRDLSAALDS